MPAATGDGLDTKGDFARDLDGPEWEPQEMELQGPNASIPWVRMLSADEVDAAAKLVAVRKVGRFALHSQGRPLRAFFARHVLHAPVNDNLSRRTMVSNGAVEGLLRVMLDADDETRVVCLQALCNLTASTPEAKAALMSNQGGIELILDLITPDDEPPAAAEPPEVEPPDAEPPDAEPPTAAGSSAVEFPETAEPPAAEASTVEASIAEPPAASDGGGEKREAMRAKVRMHAVGLLYNLTNLNAGSTPEMHYALVSAGVIEPLVALNRSGNSRDSTAAEVAEGVISMLKSGYREPIVVEDKSCLASLSRCLTPPPGNE